MSSNDAIVRINAAASALGDVDVSGWDDATLHDHLVGLSAALCRVDEQLSRVADAVRARGFGIVEPTLIVEIVPAAAPIAADPVAA